MHLSLRNKITFALLLILVLAVVTNVGVFLQFGIPFTTTVLYIYGGALVALFLLSFVLTAWISAPLQKLKSSLQQAQKDFAQQPNSITGDDLNDLIGTFNHLTESAHTLSTKVTQDDSYVADMKKVLEQHEQQAQKIQQDYAAKEAVLAAEKNQLEVLLSGITDAVIGLDTNHNVITFNLAAEKLTGYKKDQAIGKKIYDLIKIYDRDVELGAEEYCPITSAADKDGIVCYRQDAKVVGNNKEAYVNLSAGKIKGGDKVNLGCILSVHDITDERQLNEMRLNFVSMAAHELRTPLTSLKGYLNMFMEENLATLKEEQQMTLRRMQIALKQLMSLIENLLSITRMEKGAFAINPKPLNWIDYVKDTVDELQNTAKEKQIQLNFVEPASPPPQVMADSVRATEVLTNLVANAINYTQVGGTITVSLEVNENEVITHVQDTGEGIPADSIPKLFQKFYRVAGKLEHGSRGTGLGLYISKTIIDMHKGRIWVDSVLGKGSTFSFTLPVYKLPTV